MIMAIAYSNEHEDGNCDDGEDGVFKKYDDVDDNNYNKIFIMRTTSSTTASTNESKSTISQS